MRSKFWWFSLMLMKRFRPDLIKNWSNLGLSTSFRWHLVEYSFSIANKTQEMKTTYFTLVAFNHFFDQFSCKVHGVFSMTSIWPLLYQIANWSNSMTFHSMTFHLVKIWCNFIKFDIIFVECDVIFIQSIGHFIKIEIIYNFNVFTSNLM